MGDKLKEVLANVKKAMHEAEGGASGDLLENGEKPEVDVEQLKKLVEGLKQQLSQQAKAPGPGIDIHWSILLVAFVVLFSLMGLFAYRLVQSLQEKERKREEKRKLKELKKKK